MVVFLCIPAGLKSYMTPRQPIGVRQGWGGSHMAFNPASYWLPGSHTWLLAARLHTFFIAIRIRVKENIQKKIFLNNEKAEFSQNRLNFACNPELSLVNLANTVLWRAVYTPGWRSNQSGVLHHPCMVPVFKLLQYVFSNKLVLSYLLLCLLPQWWPRSCCTLWTVHCTLSLTRRQLPAFVTFFHFILQCTLHWLQLSKRF